MVDDSNIAKFHLRVENRVDVLDADVATSLRVTAVEVHAADDVRVDGQREEAERVAFERSALPDLRWRVADAYLKGFQCTCRNGNEQGSAVL